MSKPSRKPVPAHEQNQILETPAVFANKVFLQSMSGGTKIAFAEIRKVDGKDQLSLRTAVMLLPGTLEALRLLIEDWTTASKTQSERPGGLMH